MKITLISFFGVIFYLNIAAQDFSVSLQLLKIEHQKCLDQGVHMLDCSIIFYKKSDSILNLVYKKLRNSLNANEKVALKKEQLKWLKKRDKKFDQINQLKIGLGNGLDEVMSKNQKKANFVNIRTLQLDSILKKRKKWGFDKSEILKFVPNGFTILDSIRGDLNRDKFSRLYIDFKK